MGGPRRPVTSRWRPSWGKATLALAVVLLLTTAPADGSGMRRCQTPPAFSVNDVQPMSRAQGHVTLVALLSSTCGFCIQQARSLESLHQALEANGTDVHMMIVNGGPRPEAGDLGTFEELVSFDVYHDDDRLQVWKQVFQGNKDDIFIFNRCGMLTYRIRFPYSYLGYSYVTRALHLTANSRICRACPPQRNLHDTMMGDAPVVGNFGGMHSRSRSSRHRGGEVDQHGQSELAGRSGGRYRANRGRSMNRSRCPRYDQLCRELRRGRRRYNQFRSQHGLGRHSPVTEEEILRLFGRGRQSSRMVGPVA